MRLVNWFAIDPGPSTGWLQTIKGNQFNCVACASRNLTISKSPFPHKIKHRKIKACIGKCVLGGFNSYWPGSKPLYRFSFFDKDTCYLLRCTNLGVCFIQEGIMVIQFSLRQVQRKNWNEFCFFSEIKAGKERN